jgi:ABC-type Mn2+/Zn2+ transport system permease subunit
MIADFIASWSLFHHSYLAGWLMAALLALTGVQVVARNQVFLGAATAQASTLGIAVALLTSHAWHPFGLHLHHGTWYPTLLAVLFSMLASVLITRAGEQAHETHEAAAGWVFLAGGSLSILLVAHSPLGMDEIQRLLASSLIGATGADVVWLAACLALTAALVAHSRERLVLLATDPLMAAAVGLRVRRWTLALSLWIGLVVGLSIRSAGLLYTFGCLVLPALAARRLCREIAPMFGAAAAFALLTVMAASVLAHTWDVPPAQLTIALQALLVGLLPLASRRAST